MNFRLKRLIVFVVIVICVFAFMFSGCANEPETNVEPTEVIEVEVTLSIVEPTIVIEPTEDVVVEEIVEETKPKETIKKPEPKPEKENKPEKESNSNEVTEKPKEEEPKKESSDSNLVNLGKFKLTAYCNCSTCCGKWAGGATASGTMPKANRTIAVDTGVIPFGTKVVINGKTYIAEDTGSAINGNRIDIFFDSHSAALKFGVQYANVYKVVN